MTISFPDNAKAPESVHGYVAALMQAFTRDVKSTSHGVNAVADYPKWGHGMPVVSL